MSKIVTRATLPPVEVMCNNIMSMLLADMRLAQRERAWYKRARRWVDRVARISGYSRVLVASVVATLSPNVEWRDNRRMTLALLRNAHATHYRNRLGHVVLLGGYGDNIRKAKAIITHNNPSYCSGPKVTAFRDALLGVRDYAVVDVHATNIAMGAVGIYTGPGACIHEIARAYEIVAQQIGWPVVEVQSASWVIYKESKKRGSER